MSKMIRGKIFRPSWAHILCVKTQLCSSGAGVGDLWPQANPGPLPVLVVSKLIGAQHAQFFRDYLTVAGFVVETGHRVYRASSMFLFGTAQKKFAGSCTRKRQKANNKWVKCILWHIVTAAMEKSKAGSRIGMLGAGFAVSGRAAGKVSLGR